LSIKDLQEDNFEKDKVALTEIDKNIKSNDEVIVITSQSQDKDKFRCLIFFALESDNLPPADLRIGIPRVRKVSLEDRSL
jgi:helix-turn-helix protein